MRIAPILIVALLATTACDNRGDKAAKRYAMTKANGGSSDDLCSWAEVTADEYLKLEDQKNYARWKTKSVTDCAAAARASDAEFEQEMRESRWEMERQENLERAGLR